MHIIKNEGFLQRFLQNSSGAVYLCTVAKDHRIRASQWPPLGEDVSSDEDSDDLMLDFQRDFFHQLPKKVTTYKIVQTAKQLPVVCLRLPSDSTSPWTPLPWAM